MTKRHKTLLSLAGHSRFAACEIVILPLCISFKRQLLPNLCSNHPPRLVDTILSINILVPDVVSRFSSFSPSAPISWSTNRSLSPGLLQKFHNHEFSPINLERVSFHNLSLSIRTSRAVPNSLTNGSISLSLSLSPTPNHFLPARFFTANSLAYTSVTPIFDVEYRAKLSSSLLP
jgi:hypothetical protein